MSVIKIEGLTKIFGNKKIFNSLSLKIEQGEMVAITGPSGTGKTTLLNTIGLIEPIETGDFQFFDKPAPKTNSRASNTIIREKISYLFQNFALVDNLTVKENLLMGLKYVKKDKKGKEELIGLALQEVGLSGYEDSKIFEISGGEQQRVAIARAILKPSEVILADEPTGALDPNNRDEVLQILQRLNESGKTILIVTHDAVVAESCHRSIELKGIGV